MISNKLQTKIAALSQALELDEDQTDIMTEWFENNFERIGIQYKYTQDTINHLSDNLDNYRQYQKDCCGKKLGLELINSNLVYHTFLKDHFYETDQYEFLVFRGKNDQKDKK